MNYTTAIFLINDSVRAIACTYEKDQPGKPATRTMFKTFDRTIAPKDFVLVPTNTRHEMTVVQVAEVDVELDLETTLQIDWIIGTVDTADYEQLKAMEQQAIDTIKSAEKNRRREELKKSLLADSANNLMGLPIARLNAPDAAAPAEAPKPAPEA